MKKTNAIFAAALVAIGLMGMNTEASAEAGSLTSGTIASVQAAEDMKIGTADSWQRYYKEDHDCEFDHSEYGDYHDDPRYDRGEYDDDCFED